MPFGNVKPTSRSDSQGIERAAVITKCFCAAMCVDRGEPELEYSTIH